MSDTSYRLKVLEVPQGHGIERDGIIIGVTCFSTDGESRRNGVVEGTLASVRWLAVLPKYKHLLVGSRLLLKVEEEARRANCYRIMLCVASTRTSVIKWLERRDYFMGRSLPFPSLSPGHSLISEDTCLLAYLKELGSGAEKQMKLDEDPKRKHLSPIWRMSRPS